jgi:hypothetical protein
MGLMAKYDTLRTFLEARSAPQLKLSFADIERILGAPLPASARRHPAWWANERVGTHQQALAWLDAGYETRRLDLNSATIEFVRSSSSGSRSRR